MGAERVKFQSLQRASRPDEVNGLRLIGGLLRPQFFVQFIVTFVIDKIMQAYFSVYTSVTVNQKKKVLWAVLFP